MKKSYLLLLILILAGLLRFIGLDKMPPSVTGDEIQQGYTAYSLLKTGKDEWGDILPINPRSFGDYKPALYSYTLIPFEALFGLNIQAVRMPSALFGTLTVLVIYFLAKELFASSAIGLMTAFLLSIAPWHVQFSRIGWESNLGTFFFCLAVYYLIKSFANNRYLISAATLFGVTMFSYHSYKVFIPLFLAMLFLIYKKEILAINRRKLATALVVGQVFILLIGYGVLFSGAGRRASDAALNNPENIVALRDRQIKDKLPQPWGRVVNNRMQYMAAQFTENYIGYYSFSFLFSGQRSDSTLFNLPGRGLLYIWQLVPLLYGLYLLIIKGNKWSGLIFSWLILSSVPAALTREYMHTQRVEALLPILTIISAFGLYRIISINKVKAIKTHLLVVLIFVASWSLIGRVDHYFYHTFSNQLGGFQYGYSEVVKYTEKNKSKYDQIIFTKAHSEPQAFVAFYSQMDPRNYQSYSKDWVNFEEEGFKFLDMTNYTLEKYHFRNIDWDKDKLIPNALVVATRRELPDNIISALVVNDQFGKPNFVIVDTNTIQP